jgi:hypothetical protein
MQMPEHIKSLRNRRPVKRHLNDHPMLSSKRKHLGAMGVVAHRPIGGPAFRWGRSNVRFSPFASIFYAALHESPKCRYCCKSPKLLGDNFFAIKRID